MKKARRRSGTDDALRSPFPEGWYFLASRKAIEKAKLLQKTWMGEDLVVWCDDKGRVCVAEAYCPHLGSYLGSDAGGCVRGGRLVCPFHGFEFDATGQCVATPYAEPPRTARLRVFETREIAGLILGWWGIGGRGPQWELPAEEPDQSGWTNTRIQTIRLPGHPQDTTENSVDLAHLRYVHGYSNVARVGEVSVEGHYLESRFDFKTKRKVAKVWKITLDTSANSQIFGLGYSYVEIREHSIGVDMRLWILATPVDGELIDLSLVSQTREIRKPKRWIAGLGFLPVRYRAPVFNRFVSGFQRGDVMQDVVIWSRKGYRSQPRLCLSDGEIMPFRQYCKQFYADPLESNGSMAGEDESVARVGSGVL